MWSILEAVIASICGCRSPDSSGLTIGGSKCRSSHSGSSQRPRVLGGGDKRAHAGLRATVAFSFLSPTT